MSLLYDTVAHTTAAPPVIQYYQGLDRLDSAEPFEYHQVSSPR